jgi:hypothetical protein
MRSAPWSLVATAVVSFGCAGARDMPPAAATAPVVATALPPPPAPEPPPVPAAKTTEGCTSPGARFSVAKVAPKALTPAQEQAIAEGEAYLRDHPSPATAQAKSDLAEHAYVRARALFEASHWAEAATAFREIAVRHADMELGVHASMLYLESLNVLGSQADPPRAVCYDEMARDVPVLIDLYCRDAGARKNAEQCGILHKIRRDIDRLGAEKLVRRADKGDGDSRAQYEEAAVAYLALARRCVDEARAAGAQPVAERCDEIAFNAGKAFLAAGRPERAAEAARMLADPRNGMAKSPLAGKLAKGLEGVPGAR